MGTVVNERERADDSAPDAEWVSARTAARMARRDPKTILAMLQNGTFPTPYYRLGRSWCILRDEWAEYLRGQRGKR